MTTPRDADRVGPPQFEITHRTEPSDALLAGFSQYGLAGLTAANYLVDQLDLDEVGHVTVEQLPAITPFENGAPRHHTRFFSRDDLDLAVLVGELFVPPFATGSFADAVSNWVAANAVSEIAVLSGVPIPHGPEEHRVYYVATDDYRDLHLRDTDVPGMGSGFLDGVNASLLARGLDSPLAACVYVTPVHAQVPDVDAAIRLVETVTGVYDLDVATDDLQQFAREIQQYYAELQERLENADDEQPQDRMFA